MNIQYGTLPKVLCEGKNQAVNMGSPHLCFSRCISTIFRGGSVKLELQFNIGLRSLCLDLESSSPLQTHQGG